MAYEYFTGTNRYDCVEMFVNAFIEEAYRFGWRKSDWGLIISDYMEGAALNFHRYTYHEGMTFETFYYKLREVFVCKIHPWHEFVVEEEEVFSQSEECGQEFAMNVDFDAHLFSSKEQIDEQSCQDDSIDDSYDDFEEDERSCLESRPAYAEAECGEVFETEHEEEVDESGQFIPFINTISHVPEPQSESFSTENDQQDDETEDEQISLSDETVGLSFSGELKEMEHEQSTVTPICHDFEYSFESRECEDDEEVVEVVSDPPEQLSVSLNDRKLKIDSQEDECIAGLVEVIPVQCVESTTQNNIKVVIDRFKNVYFRKTHKSVNRNDCKIKIQNRKKRFNNSSLRRKRTLDNVKKAHVKKNVAYEYARKTKIKHFISKLNKLRSSSSKISKHFINKHFIKTFDKRHFLETFFISTCKFRKLNNRRSRDNLHVRLKHFLVRL